MDRLQDACESSFAGLRPFAQVATCACCAFCMAGQVSAPLCTTSALLCASRDFWKFFACRMLVVERAG